MDLFKLNISLGDTVIYRDKKYKVLGYATSVDDDGFPMIEIAWNDYSISKTGYLAVSKRLLTVEE